jgi:VWFA-related protein
MRTTAWFSVAFLLLLTLSTSAQDLVVDVNLRLLDVFVDDEAGRPVLDLTPGDFEVLDNGQPVAVKHLTLESGGIAAGLVVDRSSSIDALRGRVNSAVAELLNAAVPDDQAFLVTFAGASKLRVPWTADRESVIKALLNAKPEFGSRVYDAITDSLRYLSTAPAERRILVLFTDGADHYSTHTFEQTLRRAELTGAPIYIVGYAGDDSRTSSASGRDQIRREFEQLAGMTGGKVFFPRSRADDSNIARRIFERERWEYRIGFYSPTSVMEMSNVEVKIRDHTRRLVVRRSRLPVGAWIS